MTEKLQGLKRRSKIENNADPDFICYNVIQLKKKRYALMRQKNIRKSYDNTRRQKNSTNCKKNLLRNPLKKTIAYGIPSSRQD
jgi:hypothetical protein